MVRNRPLYVVMLKPSMESVVARERAAARTRYRAHASIEAGVEAFYGLIDNTPKVGSWVDSTDQTPDETVDEIMARVRDEGGVPQPRRMGIIVQKFGGTSVGDADRIRNVAARIVATAEAGNQVVAVVSAMGSTTNDLRASPPRSPTGPRLASSTCCCRPASASRWRSSRWRSTRSVTTPSRTPARRPGSSPTRCTAARASRTSVRRGSSTRSSAGTIPIIAGFQGVSEDTHDITTLGKGASDLTAIALAAALGAEVCEIYTDVDGVYTADPRICPKARKLHAVSYEEMLEMASSGARVLQARSVELARGQKVLVHVRSSFDALARHIHQRGR